MGSGSIPHPPAPSPTRGEGELSRAELGWWVEFRGKVAYLFGGVVSGWSRWGVGDFFVTKAQRHEGHKDFLATESTEKNRRILHYSASGWAGRSSLGWRRQAPHPPAPSPTRGEGELGRAELGWWVEFRGKVARLFGGVVSGWSRWGGDFFVTKAQRREGHKDSLATEAGEISAARRGSKRMQVVQRRLTTETTEGTEESQSVSCVCGRFSETPLRRSTFEGVCIGLLVHHLRLCGRGTSCPSRLCAFVM